MVKLNDCYTFYSYKGLAKSFLLNDSLYPIYDKFYPVYDMFSPSKIDDTLFMIVSTPIIIGYIQLGIAHIVSVDRIDE